MHTQKIYLFFVNLGELNIYNKKQKRGSQYFILPVSIVLSSFVEDQQSHERRQRGKKLFKGI